MPRIFGYARTAEYEEAPSLERQQELVKWKAGEIDGVWQGCRAEHGSGSWAERPGFRALLEELEAGDQLVVYHPQSRILFAGDAINERAGPVTMFSDVREWRKWVAGLEKLKKMEIEKIVPGHGDVCGPEIIDDHIEELEKRIAEAL